MNMEALTVQETAAFLGVSLRTVMNLIARGRFPGAYRLDPGVERSPYRIPVEDVKKFDENRKGGSK
jgi:excisionase family DNA binding protein